jgi:uncharacterized protein YraI
MTRSIFSAAYLFRSLALMMISICLLGSVHIDVARAAVMPGGNNGWLVVASRPDANAAVSVARGYSNRFPQTTVFQSNNGWYAITIGWMNQAAGNTYKSQLISTGAIPHDSYFHNGERFQFVVWSATGVTGGGSQSLFAATRITDEPGGSGGAGQRSPQGYVTGLNPRGDNYLSLRTGPGGRYQEIARMGPNTRLTILGRSGSWLNVSLTNGRSGWAHSRYIASLPTSTPTVTPPIITPPQVSKRTISPPKPGIVGDLSRSGDTFLSLRAGAGTNFPEIARMLKGTEVQMLAQQGAWIEIELENSMRGWAHGTYLKALEKKIEIVDVPIIGPKEDHVQENELENIVTNLPDGKRVALVFGNSAYEYAPILPNPKNDANDLTQTLERLGFTVIQGLDQSKSAMEGTIRSFVRNIQDADVALFFYAGHAMQMGGKNFLIPIDAKLEDATSVDFETIELGMVLNYMNAPGRLSIALLDACRDNPLSRRFSRTLSASRSSFVKRGLAAPVAGGGNILIGFATAPGEVALDGDEDNSPFTIALLKHIETPGLEIEIMLKRVKADVYAATQGSQSPWHNSALRREFYFLNMGQNDN